MRALKGERIHISTWLGQTLHSGYYQNIIATTNMPTKEKEVLNEYLRDLYTILLRKLATFVIAEKATKKDVDNLQALLQEIIKVKQLL